MSEDPRNAKGPGRVYYVANRGSDSENESDDDHPAIYNSYHYTPPYLAKQPPEQYPGHPLALRTDLGGSYTQDYIHRPPLSSPSSASSPAADDSTPPPATPGVSLPHSSTPLAPHKPLYSHHESPSVDRRPSDNPSYPAPSSSRGPVNTVINSFRNWRAGSNSRTPAERSPVRPGRPQTARHAPSVPAHTITYDDVHSPGITSPDSALSSVSSSSTLPSYEARAIRICVTTESDPDRLIIVEVGGAKDGADIRDCIFSKISLPEGASRRYSIHLTEIGAHVQGDPLTDERLLDLVRSQGDTKGSLKFYVSRSQKEPLPPQPLQVPPAQPASVLPLQVRPRRRSRSRQNSISSVASDHPAELGYDADLDNPDDSRKSSLRQQSQTHSHSHLGNQAVSPPSPGPRRRQPNGSIGPQSLLPSSAPVTSHAQPPPSPISQSNASKPPTPPAYLNERLPLTLTAGSRSTYTDRFGQVQQTPPPPPPLSPRHRDYFLPDEHNTSPLTHFRGGSDAAADLEQILVASEQQHEMAAQQRRAREAAAAAATVGPMHVARLRPEASREGLGSRPNSSRKGISPDGDIATAISTNSVESNSHLVDFSRSTFSRSSKIAPPRRPQIHASGAKSSQSSIPTPITDSRGQSRGAARQINFEKAILSKPPDKWPRGSPSSSGGSYSKPLTKGKSMDNLRQQLSYKGSSRHAPSVPSRPPTVRDPPYISPSSLASKYDAPRNIRTLPLGLHPQSPDSANRQFPQYTKGPSSYTSSSLSNNLTSPNRDGYSRDPFPRPQSASDNHSTSPTFQQPRGSNHSPSYGSNFIGGEFSRSPATMSPSRSHGIAGPRPPHPHSSYSDRSSDVPSGPETSNSTPPRTPISPASQHSPAGKVPLVIEPHSPTSDSGRTTLISTASSRDSESTLRQGEDTIAAYMKSMNSMKSSDKLRQVAMKPPVVDDTSDTVDDMSDDDYGDGGTWIVRPAKDRPPLTLRTEDLPTDSEPSSRNTSDERSSAQSQSYQSHSNRLSSSYSHNPGRGERMPPVNGPPSGAEIDRRLSGFADDDDDWAPRPLPEVVYERLEEFFPEHDLDKLVIEANSGGNSPTNIDPPAVLAPPVTPAVQINQHKRHKKSIRIVAEEHKRRIVDRTSKVDPYANHALRKRNTKMWGGRLEEVTTMQAKSSSFIPESPTSSGTAAPTFKWVRGELIGKGTYGRVYLALNATTGEMIAVKQVELPQTPSDRNDSRQNTVVQALKLESETLKDLDHPHIVQYLGFEETPTNLSIFLEYVPGGSVGSCLHKHGKFSENVTISFTAQILSGLEYLHSKGIIHRDLKADNILVEMQGTCKISDFGISKRTDDLHGGAFTAMQGTVFWMAPEVINTQKKGYNFKIDIWSVGCVVLEMWGGRRPWTGQEMVTVMFKLYEAKLPPPVPSDVLLSELADDFRRKCFAINPDERPSAAELRLHPYLELPPDWTFTSFTT
ncbi:Pkinase-domain-containing protein [Coprinopsis marcescibilis]|uniref:Pkinase-domain-containing protein n=1 Tax=Coprinopsis marcescibilis TaxID=230819 RepID=A0A5C3LBB9_COPMA|nr:Pkinase-domain-containing protein [Coprinopsis marcescibilis]